MARSTEVKEGTMDRGTAISLGIMLLVGGALAFFWSGPKMDIIRSGWGQLAMAFGGEQSRQEAQLWQVAYYGGIVGMILGAISLLAGLIRQPETR
jgi:hypothetical protein